MVDESLIPIAYPDIGEEEYRNLKKAFESKWISSLGEYVDTFEDSFSNFCGVDYGVSVSNGTTALHLALKALDIGEGDEVIVPDLTFAATINAVLHAHAVPVIVDVNLDSWTIDVEKIESSINENTKAIIPVHIYGQPCDMDKIMLISKKYNIFVIEDVAEAHGAKFGNKMVGSFGHISCFSFYGNKIMTTGEGGMCITDDESLYKKMRILRDHGMSPRNRYWHEVIGYNYRMTNLQAAIGCAQLDRIEYLIESKKKIEKDYMSTLSSIGFINWQKEFEGKSKVVWLVSILIEEVDRDEIIKIMKSRNIDVRPFFYPLSSMPIYSSYSTDIKNSIIISKKGLNLPTVKDLDYNRILEVLKNL